MSDQFTFADTPEITQITSDNPSVVGDVNDAKVDKVHTNNPVVAAMIDPNALNNLSVSASADEAITSGLTNAVEQSNKTELS